MSRLLAASSSLALLAAALVLAAPVPASAVPPTNDAFAGATPIPFGSTALPSTLVDSTIEPNEERSCLEPLQTVWFKLPAGAYDVSLTTSGPEDGDTVMAVYSGTALGSLSMLKCNDDSIVAQQYYSHIDLATAAGTTYYVQVGLFNGGHNGSPVVAHDFTLTTEVTGDPPANDDFASAQVIPVSGGVVESNGIPATREDGEPFPLTCEIDSPTYSLNTTWFRLPVGHYDVTLSTDGPPGGDTVLALYTGDTVDALTELTCNDEHLGLGSAWSRLSFRTTPATQVYAQVGHWSSSADGPAAVVPVTLTAVVEAVPLCNGQPTTVNLAKAQAPTAGDDVIFGTQGNDTISGSGGDDLVCGLGGDDYVDAGDGDDTVFAGTGDDTVRGQGGADDLAGGGGNDALHGGSLNDRIIGDAGDDSLYGGAGSDTIFGAADQDYVEGNDGNDVLSGGDGDDLLRGLAHADTVNGDAGHDVVRGGDGGDGLNGGTGDDELMGEGGNDTLTGSAGIDRFEGGDGVDRLNGDGEAETMNGGLGNDVVYGLGGADEVAGGGGDDRLVGGDGADYLHGGVGIDTLLGQADADELIGGADDDELYGGDGDDFLFGGAGLDLLSGGSGTNNLTQ